MARSLPSYVRDSLHLIALIHDLQLSDHSILFTFDITSLYTNVPTDEGLQAVSDAFLRHPDPSRPDLTLLTLLRLFLTTNEFEFDGKLWLQKHGVSMGSVYGGSYANVFLGSWESTAFSKSQQLPTIFLRYQDDIFGVWEHSLDQLFEFQATLNSIHPSIQVTLTHSYSTIRYLDLELYRLPDSDRLFHRTGFKPTDTHQVLPPDSHHPPHTFSAVLFSQVLRFATRSSTRSDFDMAFRRAAPRWKKQGYSRSAIRRAKLRAIMSLNLTTSWYPGFHPCGSPGCVVCQHSCFTATFRGSSTHALYPILHHLSCSSTNIVYLIYCSNCSARYVGETRRSLRGRLADHLTRIRLGGQTRVSAHFSSPSACNPSHLRICGIDSHPDLRKRRLKEAKWISRLRTASPHGLNVITKSCDPYINLALPYSRCAGRLASLCREACKHFLRVRPAYVRGRNLRRFFR